MPRRRASLTEVLMGLGLALAAVAGCPQDGLAPSPGAGPAQVGPETPVTRGDKFGLWTGSVHLRGANVTQRRVYPELDGPTFMGPGPLGPPYAQEDFNRLAARGANLVNISHTGLFTEKPPYQLDPAVQTNLDWLIDMAAQADLFVVISFRSGPGRGEFSLFGENFVPPSYLNDQIWRDAAAQDAWAAMWRYTAQRYRNNPVVVGYDLMVEPNPAQVVAGAYEPQQFYPAYTGTLADWNRLFPRITAAIREVDPDTPILVGAAGFSDVAWLPYLVPSGDTRTVYAVHHYAPFVYTHQSPPLQRRYPGNMVVDEGGAPQRVDARWLAARLEPVRAFQAQHGAPVTVNEYGVQRYEPGAAAYAADVLATLEAARCNHAIWLWATSYAPQAEVDDFDIQHGPDPADHRPRPDNALLQSVTAYWSHNTLRPSAWR